MGETTRGIVFRARPYSDTSLIVHWLTPEKGRLATIAKGARSSKSPLRGRLDLFYECEFTYVRNGRTHLHILREVQLLNTRPRLREDLGWVTQASYAAALVEMVTEHDTPLPGPFALWRDLLDHLPGHPPRARTVIAFELKLLRELGLEPPASSASGPGASALARALSDLPWSELGALAVDSATAAELRALTRGALQHEFGRFARGRNAALQAGRGTEPQPFTST